MLPATKAVGRQALQPVLQCSDSAGNELEGTFSPCEGENRPQARPRYDVLRRGNRSKQHHKRAPATNFSRRPKGRYRLPPYRSPNSGRPIQ